MLAADYDTMKLLNQTNLFNCRNTHPFTNRQRDEVNVYEQSNRELPIIYSNII
ncbi:hypothetical protein SCA04_17050 [Staphylococcus carnosus]|nr:hypothetical protein SCA04_17050 [Staphylococcus carnosus]GEP78863.1 hypothetical protein SCA05_06560 [Staphylococcus carnosus]